MQDFSGGAQLKFFWDFRYTCREAACREQRSCEPLLGGFGGIPTRVGVKYSWPSTQVHQVPQLYTKYKYWSSAHFFREYLSTSSTFISSTSTHIKICSIVRMDIQSRVNFEWTSIGLSQNHIFAQKSRWPYSMQSRFWMDKIKGHSQIMSLFKSQDGLILCSVNLEWTK